MPVVSETDRTKAGDPLTPDPATGIVDYTVDGSKEDNVYLMALTDEDIVGHFIRNLSKRNETIDVYCALDGELVCPRLNDNTSYIFWGWSVTADTKDNVKESVVLAPGENFSTSGYTNRDFYFEPIMKVREDLTVFPVLNNGIGTLNGATITRDGSSEEYLNFSGSTVTGLKSGISVSVLSIPSWLENGTVVKSIGNEAFKGVPNLTTVYIPNTITGIGRDAFKDCQDLKYILIADDALISSIPNGFASGCPALLGVSIPDSVTVIGSNAFEKCGSIASARLNDNIGDSAFRGCTSLADVSIGGDCKTIGSNAFADCAALTGFNIPVCVTSLGNGFIQGCVNIEHLSIAARVTLTAGQLTIGSGSALSEVSLEEGVKGLSEKALANGDDGFADLVTVSLPLTLNYIGKNAFAGSGIRELSLYLPSNGTSSTGNYAFAGMDNLETLHILGGAIPANGFAGNTNLKTVSISGGIIGESAFDGCTGLTSMTLEEGITAIGRYAFRGCAGLTSLDIPDSVTQYGGGMLAGCIGLKELTVGGGAETLSLGYNSNDSNAITNPFYIGGDAMLETLTLREGIVSIQNYIFANCASSGRPRSPMAHLSTFRLPSTLHSLGSGVFEGAPLVELHLGPGLAAAKQAFNGITTLRSVVVEGGVIGDYAFDGCTNLTNVTLKEGVTAVGRSAFQNCEGLTKLSFPDSVTSYGYAMIRGCTNLRELRIGGGMEELKVTVTSSSSSYPDNDLCLTPFFIGAGSKLEKLTLGEGIRHLGDRVFANAYIDDSYYYRWTVVGFTQLKEVEFPSSLISMGSNVFENSQLQTLTLNDGQVSGKGAFQGITTLRSVYIRGGDIGESAFDGCTNLVTVQLGGTVNSIGKAAFRNCRSLNRLDLPEGLTTVGKWAFENCQSLTKLSFPDSVTSYGYAMIRGCINLRELRIGGGMEELKVTSPTSSSSYENNDLCLTPFYIGAGSKLEKLTLGEGIRHLGDRVFANAYIGDSYYYSWTVFGFPSLKQVQLPSTLESIGTRVFNGSAIEELYLCEGMTLAEYAFADLSGLKKVTIKSGIVGKGAFKNCTGLASLTLEDGVTSIGKWAFENCKSLTRLVIPDSVTSYGNAMIRGCSNITYLNIGGGVQDLRVNTPYTSYSYENNDKCLTPFYIGSNSKLEIMVLNEGIRTIGSRVFSNAYAYDSGNNNWVVTGFPNLRYVELPSSLISLGKQAFYATNIRSLNLPSGAASGSACEGMTSLRSVTIAGGAVGDNAFSGCTGLTSVTLKEGVTRIGSYAFSGCTGLTSFEIPDSVTSYGVGMLQGCKNITWLRVGGGVNEISAGDAFNSTTVLNPFYIGSGSKLETLVLGEGITTIKARAFANSLNGNYSNSSYYFRNLTKVMLPSTLTTIETGNISGWQGVTALLLPDGLNSISDSGMLSSGLTLYSNAYNEAIDSFASSNAVPYIFNDPASLPRYALTFVAPVAGSGSRGLDDVSGVHITRGTAGEDAELPEGYMILSTEEVPLAGDVVTQEPPVFSGYAFYGWYTDPEFKAPWNMTTMPGADITLYARIEPLLHVRYAVNLASAGTQYDALPEGFRLYADYAVREYDPLPLPSDPSPSGYTFMGWHQDPGFAQSFLPLKVQESDITIYGQLEKLLPVRPTGW